MRPGDVVLGFLPGAVETKLRPAVVVASESYLRERPDALVGILTTQPPRRLTTFDHVLVDWQLAGLHSPSCFRAHIMTIGRSEVSLIGHLSESDWQRVRKCVRGAIGV